MCSCTQCNIKTVPSAVMKNDSADEINKAVQHLARLLASKDRSTIQATLTRLDQLLSGPPTGREKVEIDESQQLKAPSHDVSNTIEQVESACDISVTDVRATQSSIGVHMTEARLYRQEAECISKVLMRLGQAKLANQEEWQQQVVAPVEETRLELLKAADAADKVAQHKMKDFLRLRKVATKNVAALMLQDECKYTSEFHDALKGPSGLAAARQLGIQLEQLKSTTTPRGERHQPVPPHLCSTSPEYLHWLRGQGQVLLDTDFHSMTDEIASTCNATAVLAPLKGYARTVQKAQEDYSGDYSRILDVARGMIIFQDLPSCAKAIGMLAQFQTDGRVSVVRVKDRLSLSYNAAANFGGYRDCLLNISFQQKNGGYPVVCELQLQLQNILSLKNQKHVHYEAARSVHMFNKAFTRRRFLWTSSDTPKADIRTLLDDIRHGVLKEVDLDYSNGLWDKAAKQELAQSLANNPTALTTLSLRSCKCGDDFIEMCLADQVCKQSGCDSSLQILRLGSLLHEGTAGRISQHGIELLLEACGTSLRILDLEGCLDLEGNERCGDDVVAAMEHMLPKTNDHGRQLWQLEELNLKSTGLTRHGLQKLKSLRADGRIPSIARFLTDFDD